MTTAPEKILKLAQFGQQRGGRGMLVGGCVRDSVVKRPVRDIDIAVQDQPDRVMAMLEAAGLHVIPTGLAHGTVTAIADGRHFEITTLRRDVETDGRHARIAYTSSWYEDAARRDLTMNALFADSQGRIYDFFDGLQDLGLDVRVPEGTYFATTDVSSLGWPDGAAFCRALPERAGVVAIPSQVFYDDAEEGRHLVRWAFCKRDRVLTDALARLRAGNLRGPG